MALLENLIAQHYSELSAAQKRIAAYLLSNTNHASYLTAKELAARNGASEPVVFRMCKKLGLRGYSALQEMMIQSLSTDAIPGTETGNSCIGSVVDQITDQLRPLRQKYDDASVERIARWIHDFEHIYVMGYGYAYPLGSELYGAADSLRLGVSFLWEFLTDRPGFLKFGSNTLVVAVSLGRQYSYTLRYSEIAKKLGAQLLVITDDPGAAVAQIADHLLLVKREEYNGFSDYNTQWISALARSVCHKYIDLYTDEVRQARDYVSTMIDTI